MAHLSKKMLEWWKEEDGDTMAKEALTSFRSNFVLAFGVRAAIGVVGNMLLLARDDPQRLMSFSRLLGEKHLVFRVDAARLGMFVGSSAALFHVLVWFLRAWRGRGVEGLAGGGDAERRERQKQSGTALLQVVEEAEDKEILLAGLLANAVGIMFLPKESRKWLAMYVLTRCFQSSLYLGDANGLWDRLIFRRLGPWSQHLSKHMDSLGFILASAQIMYCYVMRPTRLPPSYWQFIVRTGPIPAKVLSAVRHSCDGNFPIPVRELGLEGKLSETAKIVPCSVLHPKHEQCSRFWGSVWLNSFKKSFILYASLNGLSYIGMSPLTFLTRPVLTLGKASWATLRSTAFLASFVAVYQLVACSSRRVLTRDHKSMYFLAGVVSSLTILLEKKKTRAELAIYNVPRALDALYVQLRLPTFQGGEILLFSVAMAIMTWFYYRQPDMAAPIVNTLMRRLYPKLPDSKYRTQRRSSSKDKKEEESKS